MWSNTVEDIRKNHHRLMLQEVSLNTVEKIGKTNKQKFEIPEMCVGNTEEKAGLRR